MALITKGSSRMGPNNPKNPQKRVVYDKIGLNIRDTDFIIRYLSQTHIIGSDIAQAHSTLAKLRAIHERLSNSTEEVE
tara:strand:+ start:344 stop:577 length:234 start_codon:yes stop_codon:yes gene_type:complete